MRMHTAKMLLARLAVLLMLLATPCARSARGAADTTTSKPEAEKLQAEFESLLDLMQIGPRQLATLSDGKPLDVSQRETVLRILSRLDDLPPEDVQRWARPQKDISLIPAAANAARGHFYRLAGNVVSVETVKLSAEDARRLMFAQYYRVRMLLGDEKRAIAILTRAVPGAWLEQERLDARATAVGLFLRLAENNVGGNEPVFAASRIAWHPPGALGELGMDVGLLGDLRDRTSIGAGQRECFYQMLAAVGRAKAGELTRLAREELKRRGEKSFSVVPLFNDPAKERGRLVLLSGTARRVVKVFVKDADIVRRFGIRHYYEIYLYTPDSQDNPVVFCVRHLPEGMPTGSDPQYSQQIKASGFFLKTWGFRPESADMAEGKVNARQLAPLLIGREPLWVEPPRSGGSHPLVGVLAGGLFIIVLLAIWLALWQSAKKDLQFWRIVRSGRKSK